MASYPFATMSVDGNVFMQAQGLGNMARVELGGSTNLPLSIGGMPNGQARTLGLRNTIDSLLGSGITINETRAVDLDKTYASAPQAAMGLTVGVSKPSFQFPFLCFKCLLTTRGGVIWSRFQDGQPL